MKKILIFFLILIAISFFIKDDVADFFTGKTVAEIPEKEKMLPYDNGGIEIHFCPQEDCEQILADEINKAETIDCAILS